MIEPTGYTALDLIGFTDRGTYAANVNYVKNDLVHYGGNIWKILIDDTIGITPAEGPNYTIFMGEPSNIVERIIAPLEDNPATVAYQTGRQIIYNDYLYEVIDDIAVGDTLITYEDDPTNANIKLSSPVVTQIRALDTRLTAAEGQININNINTINRIDSGVWTYNELNEKTVILIGDSWGVGDSGWIAKITPYFKTAYSAAAGGYSFNKPNYSYISLLEGLTVPSDVNIDAIIAIGGANATASGDVVSFIGRCKQLYHDATIIIGTNGPCYGVSDAWHDMKMIEQEAIICGAKIIKDLWLTIAKKPLSGWTSDHYHLTNYTEFVNDIIGYLTSGDYPFTYNKKGLTISNGSSILAPYFGDRSYVQFCRCINSVSAEIEFNKGTSFNAASNSIALVGTEFYEAAIFEDCFFIPFYKSSYEQVQRNGYLVYTNNYIDVYIAKLSTDVYPKLYVMGRQTGTFTKAQVFPENTVLKIKFNAEFFDFKHPSASAFISASMFTWTNDMLYT